MTLICRCCDDNTMRCRYIAVKFLKKYQQKTRHSSPVRARYGVSLWLQHLIDILPLFGTRLYNYSIIGNRPNCLCYSGNDSYGEIRNSCDRNTEAYGPCMQTIFTWNNVRFSLVRFCDINQRAISQQLPTILFCILSLNTVLLELLSHPQVSTKNSSPPRSVRYHFLER